MGFLKEMLSALFKSRAQREKERKEKEIAKARELRRAKSKAKRAFENAIHDAEDKILEFESRNEKTWEEARKFLKAGRRTAASVELRKYRALERLIDQFKKKVWVFQQYEIQLAGAAAVDDLTDLVDNFSRLVRIDPSKTLATFGDVQDKLYEQTEIDDIFNQVFDEETRRSKFSGSDTHPDLDGLMKELETEAAREIGGASPSDGSRSRTTETRSR